MLTASSCCRSDVSAGSPRVIGCPDAEPAVEWFTLLTSTVFTFWLALVNNFFFFIYINISVRGQCGLRTMHGWVTMWSRTRAADDNLTNGHTVFPAFNCGRCSLKQKPFHV